jgi:hypothetical protein
MLSHLNTTATASQLDVALICTSCVDISLAGKPPCGLADADTDQAQLTVTVVGYKPILVGLPFVGDRIPYYGQNSQTVQEFQ